MFGLFRKKDTPESLHGEVFSVFNKFKALQTKITAMIEDKNADRLVEHEDHNKEVYRIEERYKESLAEETKRYDEELAEIDGALTTLSSALKVADKVVAFAEE